MITRLPVIFFLLSCFTRPVFAEKDFRSGNYMLPHCKALVESKAYGIWEGQCGGTIDTLVWVGSSLPTRFCPPSPMPPSQPHRVVVGYLERHPEKLHEDFKGLAIEAMMEAWPCSKQ